MKDKKKMWVNIFSTILAVTIMIYLFHDVFVSNYNKYKTMTADEVTEQETVDMQAFVVRDEQYIDGNTSGTVVPLVADGNRVASGDSVARVCKSDEDAANYANLLKYKEELERYQRLSEQTELNSLDMKKLNEDIDECFTEILSISASGDFTNLADSIEDYENKLASKQVLTEGTIDLTDKFNTLNEQISTLEKKNITTSEVAAPISGYYISNIDGYEKTVDYDKITELTVADVSNALSAESDEVTDKMGKIVGSYKWYLIGLLDGKYSRQIKEGDKLKINLPYYGYTDVSVTVESISEEADNKIAVALSCNMMNETYANMRIVDTEIVLNEYTGYKVSSSSIRTEKGTDGKNYDVVYIIRGNIMNARRVEILFDADDYFVVSKNTTDAGGYKPIKLYDEVILKGRNCENGKIVN